MKQNNNIVIMKERRTVDGRRLESTQMLTRMYDQTESNYIRGETKNVS